MRNTLSKAIPLLVFSLFFSFVTHLLVGDFEIRIANALNDNVPAVYVHYAQNPGKYLGDVIETFADQMTLASFLNWTTVYANRYLSIPSEIPSLLFIFIQNVVLALALWFFVSKLVPPKHPAIWIVPVAVFLATPWWWNIAWYPDMTYIPYAGHLAAPFLVMTGAFVLSDNYPLAFLSLFLGALIHPAQTLHLSAILFFYWILQIRLRRKLFTLFAGLGMVGAVCVVPALILAGPSFNPVSNEEIMPTILNNPHFTPWQNSVFWGWEMPSTIGICLTALWVGKHLSFFGEKHRHFIHANCIALVLLSALHIAAVKLQWVQIIQLCPLRVSVLTALFLAPMLFIYYVEKSRSLHVGIRWIGTASLLMHSIFSFGFYWGPFASLAIADKKNGEKRAILFFIVWCFLFLLFARGLVNTPAAEFAGKMRSLLAPGLMYEYTVLRFLAILGTAGFTAYLAKDRQSLSAGLLLFVLCSVLIYRSHSRGTVIREGFEGSNYLAQIWAKENTPESAIFLIDDHPWRPYAERRVVNVRCEGMHMYTRNRKSKEFCDAVQEFYQSEHLNRKDLLNTEQIRRFASKFGGDYAVRLATQPLNLPEVYRNKGMILYKIH